MHTSDSWQLPTPHFELDGVEGSLQHMDGTVVLRKNGVRRYAASFSR